MSAAHPAITPVDFRVTPEKLRERLAAEGAPADRAELLVRVYDLVYRRALAALGPRPVLRERRRVLAAGAVCVAFGWREVQEAGWLELVPEEPLPEPAVPDAAAFGEPVPKGLAQEIAVVAVVEEEADREFGLADLVELMRREGLGTPATYAKAIEKLLEKGLLKVDGGRVRVSEAGRKLLEKLSEMGCPLADPGFARDFEAKLERIEAGSMRPSELLESLAFAIDAPTREALRWLDGVGELLAGEPARAAYARREREAVPVPQVQVTVEDPETTLAPDDPVRLARDRFHTALAGACGGNWWRMSEAERAVLAVEALLEAVPDMEAVSWDRRVRYDALLRWALGVRAVPARAPERYRLWLAALDREARERVRAAAVELAATLSLRPRESAGKR